MDVRATVVGLWELKKTLHSTHPIAPKIILYTKIKSARSDSELPSIPPGKTSVQFKHIDLKFCGHVNCMLRYIVCIIFKRMPPLRRHDNKNLDMLKQNNLSCSRKRFEDISAFPEQNPQLIRTEPRTSSPPVGNSPFSLI